MAEMSPQSERRNIVTRVWTALRRPSARYALGTLLFAGFIAGILFWGSYNWAMELSNTETFCTSCHEMRDGVFQELKETVHYSNRSGVRAICSDCHVPKEWIYKVIRKIRATNELFHKVVGTVNTPEKFEANRLQLAERVWATMMATDSRECRNCHEIESMDPDEQVRPARKKHAKAKKRGLTCIECHQGIAHKLPEDWEEAWDERWGS